MEPVQITITGILEDLQNGYTRCVGDTHYEEGKSIQEKYGLKKADVAQLFKHEKLKGRKTIIKKAPAFILVDDTINDTISSESALAEADVADELVTNVTTPETLTNINEHGEHSETVNIHDIVDQVSDAWING